MKKGVESGCIILDAGLGKTYLLLNTPAELPPYGSRVSVTGVLQTDVASFCMQGTPLKVVELAIVSHGGPATDYGSLIDALRAAGLNIEPAGEVEQPFASVVGYVVKVNGDDMQIFEYPDETQADSDAKLISPDGGIIGNTTIIDWISTPHFYKQGRLMVLYVGENVELINTLEAVLGPQFAGR